jgi:hypothetical protein
MEGINQREYASALTRRARELGSDTRGFVEVDGHWVLTRADGRTEIWGREPSAAERRSAEGNPILRLVPMSEPSRDVQSSAAKRLTHLLGDKR